MWYKSSNLLAKLLFIAFVLSLLSAGAHAQSKKGDTLVLPNGQRGLVLGTKAKMALVCSVDTPKASLYLRQLKGSERRFRRFLVADQGLTAKSAKARKKLEARIAKIKERLFFQLPASSRTVQSIQKLLKRCFKWNAEVNGTPTPTPTPTPIPTPTPGGGTEIFAATLIGEPGATGERLLRVNVPLPAAVGAQIRDRQAHFEVEDPVTHAREFGQLDAFTFRHTGNGRVPRVGQLVFPGTVQDGVITRRNLFLVSGAGAPDTAFQLSAPAQAFMNRGHVVVRFTGEFSFEVDFDLANTPHELAYEDSTQAIHRRVWRYSQRVRQTSGVLMPNNTVVVLFVTLRSGSDVALIDFLLSNSNIAGAYSWVTKRAYAEARIDGNRLSWAMRNPTMQDESVPAYHHRVADDGKALDLWPAAADGSYHPFMEDKVTEFNDLSLALTTGAISQAQREAAIPPEMVVLSENRPDSVNTNWHVNPNFGIAGPPNLQGLYDQEQIQRIAIFGYASRFKRLLNRYSNATFYSSLGDSGGGGELDWESDLTIAATNLGHDGGGAGLRILLDTLQFYYHAYMNQLPVSFMYDEFGHPITGAEIIRRAEPYGGTHFGFQQTVHGHATFNPNGELRGGVYGSSSPGNPEVVQYQKEFLPLAPSYEGQTNYGSPDSGHIMRTWLARLVCLRYVGSVTCRDLARARAGVMIASTHRVGMGPDNTYDESLLQIRKMRAGPYFAQGTWMDRYHLYGAVQWGEAATYLPQLGELEVNRIDVFSRVLDEGSEGGVLYTQGTTDPRNLPRDCVQLQRFLQGINSIHPIAPDLLAPQFLEPGKCTGTAAEVEAVTKALFEFFFPPVPRFPERVGIQSQGLWNGVAAPANILTMVEAVKDDPRFAESVARIRRVLSHHVDALFTRCEGDVPVSQCGLMSSQLGRPPEWGLVKWVSFPNRMYLDGLEFDVPPHIIHGSYYEPGSFGDSYAYWSVINLGLGYASPLTVQRIIDYYLLQKRIDLDNRQHAISQYHSMAFSTLQLLFGR